MNAKKTKEKNVIKVSFFCPECNDFHIAFSKREEEKAEDVDQWIHTSFPYNNKIHRGFAIYTCSNCGKVLGIILLEE